MKAKYLVLPKGRIGHEDRCRTLNQNELVVWFTGLSGLGKSTIASEVEQELVARRKAVYWLDGDALRYGLYRDRVDLATVSW